jgi:hypothetical protein
MKEKLFKEISASSNFSASTHENGVNDTQTSPFVCVAADSIMKYGTVVNKNTCTRALSLNGRVHI